MDTTLCHRKSPLSSRRDILARSAFGIGALGLASLLGQNSLANSAQSERPEASPLAPKHPHFEPKAKRVIHIFCEGGPSQVDTFDPKPALEKNHGRPVDDVASKSSQTLS